MTGAAGNAVTQARVVECVISTSTCPVETFADAVVHDMDGGARFAGLFASAQADGTRLYAVLVREEKLTLVMTTVPEGTGRFPSLTSRIPAAEWYEREIRDLFGLEADGHLRPDPLVLPLPGGVEHPRPGAGTARGAVELDLTPLPVRVSGEGVFTMPYGPVRSGVFESVEYLVETPGEYIPHLHTRVFYKHRGVEVGFEGTDVGTGALMAERYEGVASVAHAIAYCTAIERIAGVEVPFQAGLVRVLHAELERVVNHLDSTIRHTEGSGQAVAYARLTVHKERIQRLRGRLCGSRFGRGVVVPGGVAGPLALDPEEVLAAASALENDIRSDTRMLMATPSFLDRLRGTGVIPTEMARRHGALGPLGRGSYHVDDARRVRPYAAYGSLGCHAAGRGEGDALARQWVRLEEIAGAFHLIRQAANKLERLPADASWGVPVGRPSGEGIGWAEAPQGEVLYLVQVEGGRLVRVKPRSASFHNLQLFSLAFPKDILTDFAFIEASFGLSIAGVAG